ncbi:hypothetical protein [Amycolatopsis sp. NBC_01480]|uniref:hypothetical protein n=1 Tax=Amycolatopsis sp. NBC_01480 TaxID=2903562 RepID=UPI002E2D0B3F|nr:hypothetical protein [Amycolatopsis sp. NBC_01480]
MDIADLAAQAAAAAGGYLAAIAGKVADKVKDGAAERLYGLIEPRLRGTASGAMALEKLREEPQLPERQHMVAAVLQDIATGDSGFAQQLAGLVPAAAGVSAHRWTGTHVEVSGGTVRRSIVAGGDVDNSKHTLRVGTGGLAFGGVALIALLTGAGFLGAHLGSGTPCEAAGATAPGITTLDMSKTATPSGSGDDRWTVLPLTPTEAVRYVYKGIEEAHDPQSQPQDQSADRACAVMSDQAQRQFAADTGYLDCRAAAIGLGRQVTNLNSYYESLQPHSGTGQEQVGDIVTIDSCADGITGGPALGIFTVRYMVEANGEHWLIVGHKPGPHTC